MFYQDYVIHADMFLSVQFVLLWRLLQQRHRWRHVHSANQRLSLHTRSLLSPADWQRVTLIVPQAQLQARPQTWQAN